MSDEGKNASRLSILSGILLIISGTHGSVGVYGVILAVLMLLVKNVLLLSILRVVALILILLASLGGVSVIVGGSLIRKSRIRLGKFVIGIGSGMSIPGLVLTLLTVFVTRNLPAVVAEHGIMGWTGMIISLVARAKAK
ncbi:MAG: hypothetical protein ACETWE_14475 [Candidatus Bathyarchaeia archaeon]